MMTRRRLLGGLALVGAGGAVGLAVRPGAAEPPPETTRLRLTRMPGVCIAPQYVAQELLRAEGFTDLEYLDIPDTNPYPAFAAGRIDISMAFAPIFLVQVDAGLPIVLLAGIHAGCFELFGTGSVRAIRDLKQRSVAIPAIGSAHQAFVASMAVYVGLDPRKDIRWVTHPVEKSAEMLTAGKADALIGFPPVPQELRARGIGRIIVNSSVDRPWSQYFCCTVASNRDFVSKNPVATKRALRALLKATDLCATAPQRAARVLVEGGFTKEYRFALEAMQTIPYNRWREYEPEDTVRFYALRLHEAEMIKSSPQKIIAQGTDWRFLNELKKELKA
ncbi:MAG TPA: ABC transporter substrate-binding protein [Myxococcaceae bacterium]|jgi:NitT/TauT family transport system substrate-binding protein